jgi:Zn-dependent protease
MPRRSSSFRLFDVLGIRVGVDASWFVVLFVVIFLLSADFRRELAASDGVAYGTAVAAALLFFGSIVLHELGHALAARRMGIETKSIDLWFFGGLARLSRDSRNPGEEFKMAAAGPAVTLLVVIVCVALGVALAGAARFWDAAGIGAEGLSPGLLLLAWLATVNAGLLIFNLVPAYPLDGGRLARAAVWRFTGDRGRATRASARVGQGFAWFLAGLGVVLLLSGSFNGLYLLVFAFLFGSSAKAAVAQSVVTDRLDGVQVADIMDPEAVCIPGHYAAEQARAEYFDRYGWDWFPVVDHGGRHVGIVHEQDVAAAPEGASAADVADASADWTVREETSLEELLASEPLRSNGGLVTVDREGRVRGVLTLGRVRRALSTAVTSPAL